MTPDITLYFIADSIGNDGERLADITEKACRGGASLVQLREKSSSGREFYSHACEIKKITDGFGIPLIINDRADIALACGAAGVHLGQEDIPVSAARKLLGKNAVIGATAKTVEQAISAEAAGADYLGVGAIFPSKTKDAVPTDINMLKEICASVRIPVCAIGGLTEENCVILKGSGIAGIAVVSAISGADDPEAASKALRERVMSLL